MPVYGIIKATSNCDETDISQDLGATCSDLYDIVWNENSIKS